MDATVSCRHCGDVIGAYEPMIVLVQGQARVTSLAAERDEDAPAGDCYHRACYTSGGAAGGPEE
jgi:hypothetical protein